MTGTATAAAVAVVEKSSKKSSNSSSSSSMNEAAALALGPIGSRARATNPLFPSTRYSDKNMPGAERSRVTD